MKKNVMKWAAVIAVVLMNLSAQAKTQDVSGRVIDVNGEPLAFVSVSLLSEDSVYIQGATSNEEGRFLIQTSETDGILRLSYLGYNLDASRSMSRYQEEFFPNLSWASVSDVFQRSVQDMVMDCGFYQAEESTHRSNHRFNISLRYTFNASKSKYKGTGAGRAEQERMSSSN